MEIGTRPLGGVRWGAQRATAVALIASAMVLSLGVGAPFEKDQEPQSAQWIQAIVQRGQWLLPRDDYGGLDRKPPLYYWLSALAVKSGVVADDEVGARLVALIAGTLLAVAVMRWSAAFVGEATGWLALAFVLGTYGFASRATLALTDMQLSLLLFAVWCCVYRLLEENGSRAVSIVGGVLLGLAVLTKGPIAIVLIGLAGLIYLLLVRRSPLEVLSHGWPWQMAAVALAIAACWYVPAFIAGGWVVVGVFLSENFGHFMPATLGGTGEASRPLWFIAARMFGGALPQSLLVIALGMALWRRDGDERARGPLLFQLSLVLAVLIFFRSRVPSATTTFCPPCRDWLSCSPRSSPARRSRPTASAQRRRQCATSARPQLRSSQSRRSPERCGPRIRAICRPRSPTDYKRATPTFLKYF